MTAADITQYLTFDVASETYAVPIRRVHAVLEHQPVTEVPGSAAFLAGVFNRAGVVTPVVDLAARFGLGATVITRRACFVLVGTVHEGTEMPIGLLVEGVRDVIDLRPEDIQPPPDFGTRVRLDYLQGLARSDDGFTVVLDVDRFLTAEELLEMSRTAESEVVA